jgi:hypothetical protein
MKAALKLIVIAAVALAGCYYDDEETLYGTTTCEQIPSPTFSGDILPLLNMRCNNCHSGTSPSANIKLNSYTEVMKYVNNGTLMGSVKQSSGYTAMPKNSNKLSVCQIQLLQNWIDSGSLNN